jgi:hypothetical protein
MVAHVEGTVHLFIELRPLPFCVVLPVLVAGRRELHLRPGGATGNCALLPPPFSQWFLSLRVRPGGRVFGFPGVVLHSSTVAGAVAYARCVARRVWANVASRQGGEGGKR